MNLSAPVWNKHSEYLDLAFGDLDKIAESVKGRITVEFDTFIGTGLSGCLVVPYVARALGKYWAISRKSGDSGHNSVDLEGQVGKRWVFLDDLVDTGTTLVRVKQQVRSLLQHQTEYIGTFEYVYGMFSRYNTGLDF